MYLYTISIDLYTRALDVLLFIEVYQVKSNQLHAVSRTLQGRQREPSVKTLRSPLFAVFWRHCVVSGRAQRRACPRHQSEEMEI